MRITIQLCNIHILVIIFNIYLFLIMFNLKSGGDYKTRCAYRQFSLHDNIRESLNVNFKINLMIHS